MPEYFRAKYIEQRDVFVDGVKMGRTNRRIEIGGGTYAISMGSPSDYRPKWQLATIIDTFSDEAVDLLIDQGRQLLKDADIFQNKFLKDLKGS